MNAKNIAFIVVIGDSVTQYWYEYCNKYNLGHLEPLGQGSKIVKHSSMLSVSFWWIFTQQQPVTAAATPVDDDVDGDIAAILGCLVGPHPSEYAISLSNCQQNLYALTGDNNQTRI
jgi:hypothetical protein